MKAKLSAAACLILGVVCAITNAQSTRSFQKTSTGNASFQSLSACGGGLAVSQTAESVGMQGAEPGATDPLGVPAGRYQLFPDDGILSYSPIGSSIRTTYYTTDANAKLSLGTSALLQAQPWDPNGYGPTPIFATAGRVLRSTQDSLITATRVGNPSDRDSTVTVKFLDEGTSGSLPGTLLPRQPDSSDFIAIARGDLDNTIGADGNLHDEVVIARVTGESTVDNRRYFGFELDVLNYESGKASSPAITRQTFAEYAPIFNNSPQANGSGLLPSDNILSVTIGDFAGDGRKEVAIAALGDQTLLLYTYRYETTGGMHALALVGATYFPLQHSIGPGPWRGKPLVGTIAAVSGDFDGNGADEIAISFARWGNPDSSKYGSYGVGMLLLKYGQRFVATVINSDTMFSIGGLNNNAFAFESRPRVDLVAGQFLLQPPSIHYGRRQLVMGWHDTGNAAGAATSYLGEIDLQAFSVTNDLKTFTNIGSIGKLKVTDTQGIQQLFALAAGGFQGASGALPVASLGLSYWAGKQMATLSYFGLMSLRVDATGVSKADAIRLPVPGGIDYRARLPLISYDRPGRSRFLGAPVHMTLVSAPSTSFIMQEPPKHVYWDERAHKVVNFTRFDKNNVHLYSSNSASMATTSTDQTSRDTGGSLSASAGATAKGGTNFGIVKTSTEVSLDVQTTSAYDYNEHEEAYNSQYRQRTTESTGQTDRDDFLKGDFQTTDIWRYRVYGTPTGGPANAFYEIVLPGPRVPFAAGGLNFSWYQPRHENGNILSYPSRLGADNQFIPSDAGSYTLTNGTIKKNAPQVPAQLSYFDGTGSSTSLKYSSEVETGKSFTYSHEISESLDIKSAYTVDASTPFGGGDFRACRSIEVHNSNSWGGARTAKETTKDETAVTLNRAAGVSTITYPFYPVVYNTQDGTMKMSFAVPNPADRSLNPAGYHTYANLYGGLPDPALNLPSRLVPKSAGSGELEQWEPNEADGRKTMRGLFFRKAELDPVSNTHLLLAFNPLDGDRIRIEPRIYNFSTAQAATGTIVEFQVIAYDSSLNSEICVSPINKKAGVNTGLVCPRSDRTTIGRTTVPRLDPLQFTCVSGFDDPASTGCRPSAFINWDTKGFGPSAGTNEYRVYVVLNLDQPAGNEIYGSEPNPVRVINVANSTPMVVTAPGNSLETGDYVIIGGVEGLDKANGTFLVTRISDDEFSLDGSLSARGSYAGGGTAALLDPGQNNEGYGYISITRIPAVAGATEEEQTPHNYVDDTALEGLSEQATPELLNSGLTVYQNLPVNLRLTAHSNMVHTESAHVLLFDGDPSTGSPAIADQVIHPGSHGRDGTSIWFRWTPSTVGEHHLYAAMLENSSGIRAELDVNVIATP